MANVVALGSLWGACAVYARFPGIVGISMSFIFLVMMTISIWNAWWRLPIMQKNWDEAPQEYKDVYEAVATNLEEAPTKVKDALKVLERLPVAPPTQWADGGPTVSSR